MRSDTSNHYSLLGVEAHAPTDEIRRAYRARARQLHPDLAGASSAADERMAELNAAWAVLRDPALRTRYDRSIEIGSDHTADARGFATDQRGTAHAAPRTAAPLVGRHRRASPLLAVGRLGVAFSLALGAPVVGFGFASGAPAMALLGFALLLFGAVGTATLVLLSMRPSRPSVDRSRQRRRGRRGRRGVRRRRGSTARRGSR